MLGSIMMSASLIEPSSLCQFVVIAIAPWPLNRPSHIVIVFCPSGPAFTASATPRDLKLTFASGIVLHALNAVAMADSPPGRSAATRRSILYCSGNDDVGQKIGTPGPPGEFTYVRRTAPKIGIDEMR